MREAIEVANVPILLMVLVQLIRELSWLSHAELIEFVADIQTRRFPELLRSGL